MANHSIEELKRQMYAAASKKTQAELDWRAAEKRFKEARAQETGLIGKKIKGDEKIIIVERVEFITYEDRKPWRVSGPKIKKDGTPGENIGTIYLNDGWCEVD